MSNRTEVVSEIDALKERIAALEELAAAGELAAEDARQQAAIAWSAHNREKAARESWVNAYMDALDRAERYERCIDDILSIVRSNADGLEACVVAGAQCHYELPYTACKALLSVLNGDVLEHKHTYRHGGACSCGYIVDDGSVSEKARALRLGGIT